MRLALFSDLHLEHDWREPLEFTGLDADVILLGGDIDSLARGIDWAAKTFPGHPVAYVPGNHDYYGGGLDALSQMRSRSASNVHILDRNTLRLPGLRILGCTLWSGFDLHGAAKRDAHMAIAQRSINDYRLIRALGDQILTPHDTLRLHNWSVQWLDKELGKPFDGRTVVLTHFGPHRSCVPPQYQGDTLSPYFVTDLAWLMDKHRIDLWCYGHTHTNIEFRGGNDCLVVSNQRGYPHERCKGFRADRIIEL